MDLTEYIDIFRKQARAFGLIVALSTAVAFAWQGLQPKSYDAALLLNIGRSGSQMTTEYAYDDFYRLQADERFADTVVRWLQSPRVVEDIYAEAKIDTDTIGLRGLRGSLSGKRLSSQMVEVSYGARNERQAVELSRAIISVLNRYTESLDREGHEPGWFAVIGSDPVIRDGRTTLPVALAIGAAIGIFLGFWIVLLRYYFQSTKNR
jgi:uncharacterized protein involved in exopolysaccharide biosynthesis